MTYISPLTYYYPELLIVDYYKLLKDNTINKPINLLNYDIFDKEIQIKPVVLLEKENKKIYIYSTHPKEEYSSGESVLKASSYLKDKFKAENIDVTIEKGDINEFLVANNYSYNNSYKASRYFIEEELKNNQYDLIIDLHRDAVSRNSSLTTINGKKCAKVMFVIGKKNINYKKNYELAKELNALIEKSYPTLTRGVLLQSGSNVNGIYNQDLNENMLLIELGGNKNNYNEVKNTIDLIVPIIGEYLNGKKI